METVTAHKRTPDMMALKLEIFAVQLFFLFLSLGRVDVASSAAGVIFPAITSFSLWLHVHAPALQ